MRKFIIIIFTIWNTCICYAQNGMADILSSMPEEIVPYLTADKKMELGKFLNSNDTLKVKNSLNGETSIDSVSGSYMRIKLNLTADIQVKLLPQNDSVQIICVIKTLKKPAPESRISFYSTNWNRLDDAFGLPDTNNPKTMLDMLTCRPDTMSTDRYNELRYKFEPIIANAEFTGTDNTITFSLSQPLLNKEEKRETVAIIKQKSFKWSGEKFN